MQRIIAILITVGVITGALAWFYFSAERQQSEDPEGRIVVERGDLVEYALAVGHIEPRNEIEVKSKISGVVSRMFVQAGDFVRMGDPLMEIRPDPTPLELAEAKRNLQRQENRVENLKEDLQRLNRLMERDMVSRHEFQEKEWELADAEISLAMSRERLELLESGRIILGDVLIESVIRAPADGFILQKSANVGDPIVPLTSYQAGTSLMTLAPMDDLLFKGTVDEIDVGKLNEGMPVNIRVGALPEAAVSGLLTRISLKAESRDNGTVFPVEIKITGQGNQVLRAGYSASAHVIVDERKDVLRVPERVVYYEDGNTHVEVPGLAADERERRPVRLGLSDALFVEVIEGLEEGELVLEKPLRSVASR